MKGDPRIGFGLRHAHGDEHASKELIPHTTADKGGLASSREGAGQKAEACG